MFPNSFLSTYQIQSFDMKKFLFLALFFGLSFNSFAQDERTWRVSLGAGVIIKKNNRVANKYEDMNKKVLIKPIPFITGSIGRLSLGGQGIAIRVLGNHLMNFSTFIKRDGDRYFAQGMGPRKDSVFVGLSGKFFKYGLSVSKDINGRSKGSIVQFNYGEFYKISEGFMLRAGLGLDWHDDRYAEYYYGVRAHEATGTNREYHLKNYFMPGINFLPIYKLSENGSLTAGLNIKLIPKMVRNSPTMNGDKFDIGGLVGFSYSL